MMHLCATAMKDTILTSLKKLFHLNWRKNTDFKLCIHRRDFKAGWDIKWNIMNAIRNSNSAIIIMSQHYINSLWCVEEFEDCYMEKHEGSSISSCLLY